MAVPHVRLALRAASLVAVLFFPSPAQVQENATGRLTPVDLELAFVVDASGSIDDAEMQLQRQGYLDALTHPRVQSAITGGFLQSIAVAYIEFAGSGCTQLA